MCEHTITATESYRVDCGAVDRRHEHDATWCKQCGEDLTDECTAQG